MENNCQHKWEMFGKGLRCVYCRKVEFPRKEDREEFLRLIEKKVKEMNDKGDYI
jgi:hypothetical protein